MMASRSKTSEEVVVKRWWILLLVATLIAAACTSDEETAPTTAAPPTTAASTTTAATPTSAAPTTTTSLPPVVIPTGLQTSFGEFAEVPLLSGAPYAGPSSPSSLAGVAVNDWIAAVLDRADAESRLVENGFVVVPSDVRHFHHIYEGADYGGYPVFVTTDAAYHVWHLAFDKILRETEQQTLLPALEDMLARLVEIARAQETELAGTGLADAAGRVTQFYEAAAAVTEVDVGPIGPLAQAEAELIRNATQIAVSPTTGGDELSPYITRRIDYTLFRPRGHYTRNEDLERFFRGMSQLGNNAFLIDQGLVLGILASRVLLSDPDVVEQWQLIYEPTAWLVGAADDYTPFEVGAVVEDVIPTGWSDLTVFADPANVEAVAEELRGLRGVGINPEAASLRIMGSRWVIDSFIYDQLVMDNISNRWKASPLDLAAAFGSEWAYETLEEMGETDYPGYDEQLDELTELVAGRTIEDWGRTVYDAWLYALTPMWLPHGEEYPDFMRSRAWDAKAHQTGFGSYTELKHDTILYTKQAVAEGGNGEPPEPPRHWVEPEPVVYQRLANVTDLMQSGLDSRGLLPDEYAELLVDLRSFYEWLAGIAEDELAGRPISPEDNQELSWIGSTLEGFWVRTSDADLDWESGPDSHAALIADVMRSQTEGVLELGTGYIDHIFVLVPDDEGNFQVASGGVYSYYEFWSDAEQRLTDEEWRELLAQGTQPARPDWQQVFLAGEPPPPSGLQAGLFCRDLEERGYDFWTAAIYWISEGAPDRMDADQNGIPCETVFPAEQIDGFLSMGRSFAPGLSCTALGLPDDPDTWLTAVAYWMLEGKPDRMDPDGNGIPCEDVFSAENIQLMIDGVLNPNF
jgi:hypothetical protein